MQTRKQRTGVAIYVLLRLLGEAQADSLSMMKTMRLKMHEELLRDRRGFFDNTERILTNSAFRWEYAYALTVFCI